jgi:hypothetical protein
MTDTTLRGTRVHTPDLDWSQVRETVLMLELSAGQIEGAMTDSNSSVDVLTQSFTTMADSLQTIAAAIQRLPTSGETGAIRDTLENATGDVSTMVNKAIVAFQFYDKLVQRMGHVTHSLAALSELVADRSRLFNPEEWRTLQEGIRSKYTMKEEQAMFEAVMQGMPVQQAIQQFLADMNQQSDDIELF